MLLIFVFFRSLPIRPTLFPIYFFIFSAAAVTQTTWVCLPLTSQPTAMDAMALVHSRIRRVVYAMPSDDGAIGTRYHINTLRSLNHRYRAYVLQSLPLVPSSVEDGVVGGDMAMAASNHALKVMWRSILGTTYDETRSE